MTDPNKNVDPVADVPAASQVPASPVQSTPGAEKHAGVSSNDVKQVPLPALQEERAKRQEEASARQSLEAEVAELRRMVANTQQQQYQPQQLT